MKRRFYCKNITSTGDTVELPSDESHHFRNVLRGRGGEELSLMDCAGKIAEARVVSLGRKRDPVVCELTTVQELSAPQTSVILHVSPMRSKNMPLVVRSATELGVSRIIPLLCDRSESRPSGGAPEAWIAAGRVACKQSGNPYAPTIGAPQPLADVLASNDLPPGFVGCPPQPDLSASAKIEADAISLFIGPEGGFTEIELKQLLDRGLQPLSIGQWTLRVETAVIACLSWLNQRYPQ